MPPLQADTFDPNQGLKMAHDSLQKSKVKDKYKVKCVLVGDGATGKTSLILSYSSNAFPTEYVPTAYDTYSVDVTVDSNPVRLEICDTAGQDDFDNLRPLCYPGTDAFLLCFSVVNPTSFHNISEKWAPELRKKFPKTPLILVGTLCDLRDDVRELIQLDRYNERPVSEEEAEAKARELGALRYIECSALTQKNMKEVFDLTILAGLDKKGVLVNNGKNHSLGFMGSKRWKKYRHHQVTRSAVFVTGSPSSEQIDALPQSQPQLQHKRTDLDRNGNNGSVADCSSSVTSVSHGRTKKKRGWKKFCCFS